MKIQLKTGEPDRVEVGNGPRVYLFERGKEPFEVPAGDWPALERTGHLEEFQEKPAVKPAKKEEK